MRNELKTAFRPALERVEARLVATAGVVSALAVHHPAHVAPHHVSHAPKHPAKSESPSNPNSPATPPAPTPPKAAPPKDSTTDQAWVELVNMTGQDLEYQLKLGPYDDGQFLPFDIAAGATQDRYSSLISDGQRVKADFAIQFGNGPVTPLMTGISQQSAQGYYIFLDSNLQYYVEPFIK